MPAKVKSFDATGIKQNAKAHTKDDYHVINDHGSENRMTVEKFINARKTAEATGSARDKATVEKLRPFYEAAISGSGIDDCLSIDTYRRHVINEIGGDLDAGKAVVDGLFHHFTRLQAIHDDFVIIDDPARDSRSATKLTWAEARAMGYFYMRNRGQLPGMPFAPEAGFEVAVAAWLYDRTNDPRANSSMPTATNLVAALSTDDRRQPGARSHSTRGRRTIAAMAADCGRVAGAWLPRAR